MKAARILLAAANKHAPPPKVGVPVEMYPLFAAMGVAVASLSVFTYRHFAHDKHLRLWSNPDLSAVDDVLNKAVEEEKKEASK